MTGMAPIHRPGMQQRPSGCHRPKPSKVTISVTSRSWGGFTGLSAALHLAERGYSVILLDAHRIGWGASGRNGGQVGTGQRVAQDDLEQKVDSALARDAWQVAQEAKALVKDLIARHDIPCDYRSGSIHANHRQRFDHHSQNYVALLNEKYSYDEIRYVPPEEMRSLVGSKDYSAGTLDMGAGHLPPAQLRSRHCQSHNEGRRQAL